MTSTISTGECSFVFSQAGFLMSTDFTNFNISENQQIWLLQHLPKTVAELLALSASAPSLTVCEVPNEISFEMFWLKYDDKESSSKKRCFAKWAKMTEAERLKAYRHIPFYFRSLPQGTRKKYAETYLNAELWNN